MFPDQPMVGGIGIVPTVTADEYVARSVSSNPRGSGARRIFEIVHCLPGPIAAGIFAHNPIKDAIARDKEITGGIRHKGSARRFLHTAGQAEGIVHRGPGIAAVRALADYPMRIDGRFKRATAGNRVGRANHVEVAMPVSADIEWDGPVPWRGPVIARKGKGVNRGP